MYFIVDSLKECHALVSGVSLPVSRPIGEQKCIFFGIPVRSRFALAGYSEEGGGGIW